MNENGGPVRRARSLRRAQEGEEDLDRAGPAVEEKPHELPLALMPALRRPVEPLLSTQWFVKMKPLADEAVEGGEQRAHASSSPRRGRRPTTHWMHNIQDWCISRQLWWGHQIPAWYAANPDGTVDFEKRDAVVSRAKRGERQLGQDPDVLDTWFSSALWPFSTLGWPSRRRSCEELLPDLRAGDGHDILFFWVARMMMMGIHFMGDVPFKRVSCTRLVRDENGDKMCKVKGNVIDPLDIIGAPRQPARRALKNKYPQGCGLRRRRAALHARVAHPAGPRHPAPLERIEGYRLLQQDLERPALRPDEHGRLPGARSLAKERALLAGGPLDPLAAHRARRPSVQTALAEYQLRRGGARALPVLLGRVLRLVHRAHQAALRATDEPRETRRAPCWRSASTRCCGCCTRSCPSSPRRSGSSCRSSAPPSRSASRRTREEDRRLDDPAAEAEMKPIIEAIEGIRTIRGESNLSPALKVEAQVSRPTPRPARRSSAGAPT